MRRHIRDKTLVLRAKSGDKEAFGQLYDLYISKIYRFIYFKVSSQEEAEDLTSETFLKAWQYINSGSSKKITNFSALLYKIARNSVIDFYRRRSQGEILGEEALFLNEESYEEDLNEKIQVRSEMEGVERNLKKLKDEYREVIILRFIEEFRIGEIAKILDKPQGAVRVLIHRALKSLREEMEETK
ncbi:MAG: hypothetical protein COY82_00585 [Parcubacteria group bacterium CG_4_10_14_0_8_um_filter_35_7]|nr:MAG: hypothetical protein COY82_00585 [Parcubacteria group bacterium CG_4_10_14_0_8_um_filter_35_7]